MDTEYLKKVGIYILSVILSLAIIFYLGYHLWHSLTREVETLPVAEATAEKTLSCEGYIFRNETVLPAVNGGNTTIPTVKDGTKVVRYAEVAKTYSSASSATVASITEIDEKIELLENCSSGEAVSLKESSKIDKEVDSVLGSIRDASGRGDMNTVNSLRSTLMKLLTKRNLLSGKTRDFNAEINELKSEKENLRASLGGFTGTVTTPDSGYYYSETDGYEDVFVASELSDMTYGKAVQLMSSSPSPVPSAGKTVLDADWYLVIKTDKKYTETFKEGKGYTVRFTGDLSLDMEVYRVVAGEDGVILMLTTKYIPAGFAFTRVQKAELVYDSCKGYKVPLNAVRVVDGYTGVYVLDSVTIRFRTIETVYKTDSYYIVIPGPTVYPDEDETDSTADTGQEGEEEGKKVYFPLQFHDNLITEGKGLFHGRVIG